MHRVVLNVDGDGQVIIPKTIGAHVGVVPGGTVTVAIDDATRSLKIVSTVATEVPIPKAEQVTIKARVKLLAEDIRADLPEPWRSLDHGALLYGEDGLPG